VIAAKAEGAASSVATLKPRPELAASEVDIVKMARLVDQAGSVVIMCGAGCRRRRCAAHPLGLAQGPLVHSVKGKDIMPYDDPRCMGGVGMIGTKAAYNAVMHCDMLLMVGTDYPIQTSCRPKVLSSSSTSTRKRWDGGRRPCSTWSAPLGRASSYCLIGSHPKDDTSFWDKVTKERRRWDETLGKQADLARSKDRIHPQAVARAV
jgi:pyruvate dehydrogenase (quinone)